MKPRLLHVWVLSAFALAQPVYDVLRKSAEFFVAHEADRLDLLLLTLMLSVVLPGIVAAIVWAVGRVSTPAGKAAMLLTVAGFTALIAMQGLRAAGGFPTITTFAVAAFAGAAAAWLYARFDGLRQVLTVLSPAIVIFPALFLMHGNMRALMRPPSEGALSGVEARGETPVVMVVFDQLPLVSLMGGDDQIDATAFPSFAALQRDALWFRNATTVADLTGWALPAILSGEYPVEGRLPVTADHPRNLFTTLGSGYTMEVVEPITQLCPRALCPRESDPRAVKQLSMLADLSVVYPRIFLPPAIAATLPPLTDNWRDFAQNQDWRRRWVGERDRDRRLPPQKFIESISRDDPASTLYFMHVLLPHEPYIYLGNGAQFTDETALPGLREGRWTGDEWLTTQAYQRHLLQVQFVDTILGRLVARLKEQGLYDRALLVVTSDHGVAFTPRRPFKAIMESTVPSIVPVPLFIKRPFSRGGEISDRNVQAIDVLPTVADILDVTLPWTPAGASALGGTPEAADKTLFYNGAKNRRALPSSMRALVSDFVGRKLALFGPPKAGGHWQPLQSPAASIIDRPVSELTVGQRTTLRLRLNDRYLFDDVEPESGFVPARLTGQVMGERGAAQRWPLAIAINGVVRATTWSGASATLLPGRWSAIVNPRSLSPGRNAVDVFVIDERDGAIALQPGLRSVARPEDLNLAGAEAIDWGVETGGLHVFEDGPVPLRWTNGSARIVIEVPEGSAPRELRIGLAPHARATPLQVVINGCTLFDGSVPGGAWERAFDLATCPADVFASGEAIIEIRSPTFEAPGDDPRTLGVPLASVQLRTT
ncbi:MAG: sulfatase-like hydrolase/transferase [Acidobacteriota bacterium]|nr:sulfatase-like hydrolase/transferase [Acidobacteriota bacterium]